MRQYVCAGELSAVRRCRCCMCRLCVSVSPDSPAAFNASIPRWLNAKLIDRLTAFVIRPPSPSWRSSTRKSVRYSKITIRCFEWREANWRARRRADIQPARPAPATTIGGGEEEDIWEKGEDSREMLNMYRCVPMDVAVVAEVDCSMISRRMNGFSFSSTRVFFQLQKSA